jgi:hypothetical protein
VKRRTKRTLALLGGTALLTLAWPSASSAETSLGGYSGTAQAEAVRLQIYEPTIPIPASPQIDGGIGYAKSNTDTGPVSRATASYLWPGDVLGDGFGALSGDDSQQYPVQVNSRYPATKSAPEHNTAQLTDGNGMTTSSNETSTKATVTGLGIAGPDTDLLGSIGDGLNKLPGMPTPTNDQPAPSVPLPVSKTLAGLVTMQNVKSQTDVEVGSKSVTSTARTYTSEITLLGGLITLSDVDVTTKSVSDGVKAKTSGSIKAVSVKVAGENLGLGDTGIALGGDDVKLPDVPDAVGDLLDKIGIKVTIAPTTRNVDGAGGSLEATALVFSIDTQALKNALNLGGIIDPLRDMLGQIPKLGDGLSTLLGLGPKIVFLIGDASASTTAAPAYVGGPLPGSGGGGNTGNVGGGNTGNVGGGNTGNVGGVQIPGGDNTPVGTSPGSTTPGTTTPTSFALPGLGKVPRMMILGGLLLAALVGWALRSAAGFVLGVGRSCAFGLDTGVPDLRKG